MGCFVADRVAEYVVSAREQIKAARVKDRDWTTMELPEACEAFFKANRRLKSFSWRQYTPLFSDDPCCFRLLCDEPDINGIEGPDIQEGTIEEQLQMLVTEFVNAFSDDMEGMFGDHVKLIFDTYPSVDPRTGVKTLGFLHAPPPSRKT